MRLCMIKTSGAALRYRRAAPLKSTDTVRSVDVDHGESGVVVEVGDGSSSNADLFPSGSLNPSGIVSSTDLGDVPQRDVGGSRVRPALESMSVVIPDPEVVRVALRRADVGRGICWSGSQATDANDTRHGN